MNTQIKECPLCKSPANETGAPDKSFSFYIYDCSSCGEFATDRKIAEGKSWDTDDQRIDTAIHSRPHR